MTLKAYPSSLNDPNVKGFRLEPKFRNSSMKTEEGQERIRSVVSGDVYLFKATFKLSEDSQKVAFDNFLKYDINYGRDWFTADWNQCIGYSTGTQAFIFTDIRRQEFGDARIYTASMLMQPVADAPDPDVDWPTNELDPGFLDQRFACISPSSNIVSVTSSSIFTLKAGEAERAKWRVGWVLDLFDLRDGSVVAEDEVIQSISTDQITLVSGFSTLPLANLHGIRFSEYDNVIDSQKRFGFVSDEEIDFPSDGDKVYRIMYGQ